MGMTMPSYNSLGLPLDVELFAIPSGIGWRIEMRTRLAGTPEWGEPDVVGVVATEAEARDVVARLKVDLMNQHTRPSAN